MQEFSLPSGKTIRAVSSSNPEFRNQIAEHVARAYYNIHGLNITSADPQWTNTIIAACMQLCMEDRAHGLTSRELINLFQNVIRISEEHVRESKRHAAMATNVFYLKETALDSALYEQSLASHYQRATTMVVGMQVSHSGRVRLAPADADDAA
ncbi:MAG: hypothetical protein J0M34_00820 [Alphaproteobacteria bacterium]|nr:hypothetical protein [Alphaproteobacteria bacterium]